MQPNKSLEEASHRANQDGDAHLQERHFPEAFEAYFRSAELNPQHHRALSSISQTQFERGNYELSVKYLKDAVRLLDPGRASRATLRSLARMNLLLKEYDEASRYVGRMNPGVSKDRHSDALDMALQTHAAQRRCARNVRNLPRYKPTAANASKYFSVGDDDATSMYDKLLESHTDENENHSFFFTGICDSRHIFQTLISIVINGAAQPGAPATKFHFTIHDADPVVLARNMIFYFLLEQLAPEIPKLYYKGKYAANWISKKGEKILATLFFTYIAQVMPPVVFDHLQATIGLVIESLLGTTELPSWIKLDPKGIPPMLEALRFWQSQGVSKFSTGHFIDQTCSRHDLDEEDYLDTFTWVPDGCEAEIMDYCETAMLLPPSFAIDPCLQQILDLSDSQERRRVLRPYIRMNWKPNVTLVHSSSEVDSHLGHNPADLMYHLYNGSDCNLPSNPNKLFDYAYDFFGEVARAVKLLGDRLVFEVVSGEVTQVLDSIRYRFEEDRDPTYPTEYDRIHLSNVPDYLGGSLFNYIFAMPLLKHKPSSFVTSCSMLERFSLEDLNNEYALLPDASSIEKAFKAKATHIGSLEGTVPHSKHLSEKCTDASCEGMYYCLQRTSSKREFSDLLTEKKMEKWLYGLFMKIALPTSQPPEIYSPFNLTIFFRVVETLYQNKYPAHWLDRILVQILANNVSTTTRPPDTCPLEIPETRNDFPKKPIDLNPFMAEFRTLTAMWLTSLPFGFRVKLPIPSLTSIHQYSIIFDGYIDWCGDKTKPVFALLLVRRRDVKLTETFSHKVRDLLTDERDHESGHILWIRSTCAVITCFEWDMDKKVATFWLHEFNKQDKSASKTWCAFLIRTDVWRTCATSDKISMGDSWVE